MDFSGHGRSSHLLGLCRPYTFLPTYMGEILAVLDYFGLEKVIAIGHSMGGGILTTLTAAFPERFSHLILIENIGLRSHDTSMLINQLRTYFDRKQQIEHPNAKRKPIYKSIQAAIDARTTAQIPISLSASRILAQRGLKTVYNQATHEIEYTWRTDQALMLPWPNTYPEKQIVGYLAEIQCEVLLFVGTDGHFDSQSHDFKRRLNAIKRHRVVTLSGEHHLHLQEDVHQIVNEIKAFVQISSVPAKL